MKRQLGKPRIVCGVRSIWEGVVYRGEGGGGGNSEVCLKWGGGRLRNLFQNNFMGDG